FNEGKGIWGTWEMPSAVDPAFMRGGFHIWPEGMADPTQPALSEEIEEPIIVEPVADVEQQEHVPVGTRTWTEPATPNPSRQHPNRPHPATNLPSANAVAGGAESSSWSASLSSPICCAHHSCKWSRGASWWMNPRAGRTSWWSSAAIASTTRPR